MVKAYRLKGSVRRVQSLVPTFPVSSDYGGCLLWTSGHTSHLMLQQQQQTPVLEVPSL